jgi:hypothetical protein
MSDHPNAEVVILKPLIGAWLALMLLTLLSVALSRWWVVDVRWLAIVVATIVWVKGWLVARAFIESRTAVPFIRYLLGAFMALAPVALVLTGFFGRDFARWTTL